MYFLSRRGGGTNTGKIKLCKLNDLTATAPHVGGVDAAAGEMVYWCVFHHDFHFLSSKKLPSTMDM